MSDRVRRTPPLALGLALAVCASVVRAGPELEPAGSRPRRALLRVDAPAQGERLRQPEARVQVRGHLGAELYDGDLVIALDASNSALLASGVDLDADGVVGTTREFAEDAGRFVTAHPRWTSDADDTLLRAELVAARALIDALAQRRNRIGLLTYTSRAQVRAQVGVAKDARRVLDAVPIAEDRSGTDVSQALRHAALLLQRAPGSDSARPRAVLLCSDGEPTVPATRYNARQRALREAARLADQQIALYVLAFGAHLREERSAQDLEFLRALAQAGRGVLIPVDAPAQLLRDLPPARAQPSALEIANLTTGESARSPRLAPDGAFAAWLALAPGANELRVRANWQDGRAESLRRTVHFEGALAPAAAAE